MKIQRERDIFHPVNHSWGWARLKQGAWLSLWVSHVETWSPSAKAALCFAGCISSELDWEQNGQDTDRCTYELPVSHGGFTCCATMLVFYLLFLKKFFFSVLYSRWQFFDFQFMITSDSFRFFFWWNHYFTMVAWTVANTTWSRIVCYFNKIFMIFAFYYLKLTIFYDWIWKCILIHDNGDDTSSFHLWILFLARFFWLFNRVFSSLTLFVRSSYPLLTNYSNN